MIEKLKDLEQEAMDNITPEDYMAITSSISLFTLMNTLE